ncbi:helix-turn-helix transcriptional regulator [Mitsuaria sp. GD03876]|uniref:AraC family transcriptional regulator n=1 Tax=Mitsuaria sp. GD03876 TaxID=2975399 RepID=UPI00244A2497|nr:helix-turn-helix transcriptional regulator [Mitsuaria sp. GD03876]MDH0866232.1 helix-turn-helix transcriptional regulator [Mitsuaria sp. GD03876]
MARASPSPSPSPSSASAPGPAGATCRPAPIRPRKLVPSRDGLVPGRASVPPLDPRRYAPSEQRPVRAKSRSMDGNMDIQAHFHTWGQLVFSVSGVVRVSTDRATFLVPPSRAVWIPAGVVHAVTAVERCELRTLYLLRPPATRGGDGDGAAVWLENRVLEVSPLLRELVVQLALDDPQNGDAVLEREVWIGRLILDEIGRARSLQLGVALPTDKRLRRLCEAVLAAPMRHASLDDWAAEVGASARTVSRLFRQELGSSYAQWRQQALLAEALRLAAQRKPMQLIAAELGYASASAFTAMVTRTVGMPPSRFFGQT